MPRKPTRPGEIPGLTKNARSGIWYYRRAVAPALRPKLNRREVLISLETRDEAEARAKVVEEAKRVERMLYEAKAALLESSQPSGDHALYTDVSPERWTLAHLLDAWGDDLQPFDLERYRAVEMAVARFTAAMGDLTVSQITPTVLRAFKRKLETTPHQGSMKPLDARAIASTMDAFRTLLRGFKQMEKADG